MRRKPSTTAETRSSCVKDAAARQQSSKALSVVGLFMGLAPVTCALAIHLVAVLTTT